jgi:hypothetical protein
MAGSLLFVGDCVIYVIALVQEEEDAQQLKLEQESNEKRDISNTSDSHK